MSRVARLCCLACVYAAPKHYDTPRPRTLTRTDVSATRAMNARLRRIKASCRELCDMRRPTMLPRRGHFNFSVALVNCSWLLADNTGIDAVREQETAPKSPPKLWLDDFTMHGRLRLVMNYWNDSKEVHAGGAIQDTSMRLTAGWERSRIDGLVRQATGKVRPMAGKPAGASPISLGWAFWSRYRGLNRELWVGIHHANVRGKEVLVIGSESPWVEVASRCSSKAEMLT